MILQVTWKVVLRYLRALSLPAMICLLLGYLLQMGTDLASNIWLSEWSEDTANPDQAPDPGLRLGVYGGIGAGQSRDFYIICKCLTCEVRGIIKKGFLCYL